MSAASEAGRGRKPVWTGCHCSDRTSHGLSPESSTKKVLSGVGDSTHRRMRNICSEVGVGWMRCVSLAGSFALVPVGCHTILRIRHIFKLVYFICIGVFVCVVCVHHVHACRVQKRASDPWGPKLQPFMSHHVGVGIKPRSSGRATLTAEPVLLSPG